jgi:hypothetical protein
LPVDWTASVWNSAPCACANLRELPDRLYGADLVVRVHHRYHRDVIGHRGAERIRRHDALCRHGKNRALITAPSEMPAGVEHGFVLDCRRHDAAALACFLSFGSAAQGEVVRFGAAGSEDDLCSIGADELRDRRAGIVQRSFGLLPETVHAGRVSERLSERAGDGLHTSGWTGVVAL